jgi:hypothetical protein
MINVVRPLSADFVKSFVPLGTTKHLTDDRNERMRAYKPYLSTDYIYGFEVDNNHPNGRELHFINKNGLVYVYNQLSRKFITITHPRSKQLMHYFLSTGLDIPKDIHKLCVVLNERNRVHNLNDK